MKKQLPNFRYTALSGYIAIGKTVDQIVTEEQTAIEQTHLQHWYETALGRKYLEMRKYGNVPEA